MAAYLLEENPRRRRRGRRRSSSRRRRSRSRRSNPANPTPRRRRRRSRGRRRSTSRRRRNPFSVRRGLGGLTSGVMPAVALFASQWVGEFLTGTLKRYSQFAANQRFGYVQMAVGVLGGILAQQFSITRPYSKTFAVSNLAFGFYNAFLLPTGGEVAAKSFGHSLTGQAQVRLADFMTQDRLGQTELVGLGDFATGLPGYAN